MKNLLRITFIIIVSLCIAAQAEAQSLGVKTGLNLCKGLVKDDDEVYSNEDEFKIKGGFNIGAVFEIPITDFLWIEPGLLFSVKGMRTVWEGDDWKETEKANVFYLDIPVNVLAGYDFGSVKVYGILGPYVGIGLAGKYKWEEEWDGETDSGSEDIEWGSDSDEDDLRRPDAGLTFGVGAQFKGLEFSMTRAMGLANISSYQDGGFRIKNRVTGISIAYKFNLKGQ